MNIIKLNEKLFFYLFIVLVESSKIRTYNFSGHEPNWLPITIYFHKQHKIFNFIIIKKA